MWKTKSRNLAKTREYRPSSAVDVASAAATTLPSHSVTWGVTLTSTSLLTSCCSDERRLDRRLDLRELYLPVRECLPRAASGATWNWPSVSSRCGTCFSSFFCRLRWVRLPANHNRFRWVRLPANHNHHTQVNKTIDQSQQTHVRDTVKQSQQHIGKR